MEAAQALHGKNATLAQQLHGLRKNRIAFLARVAPHDCEVGIAPFALIVLAGAFRNALFAVLAQQRIARLRISFACLHGKRDLRPTLPTCIRLSMKTPVQGVGILFGAFGAHRKRRHRSVAAIVRQLIDDGEAWPAIRAIDKWIAVPAVTRVEKLLLACSARCKIGGNKRGFLVRILLRRHNLEIVARLKHAISQLDFRYMGGRWRGIVNTHNESIQVGWFTFCMHLNAKRSVQNPAGYAQLMGASIHKGAETHPLHNSFYGQIQRFAHGIPLSSLSFAARIQHALPAAR